MDICFETILWSNVRTKILMWALSNVHAGRIWPAGSPPLVSKAYTAFVIKMPEAVLILTQRHNKN